MLLAREGDGRIVITAAKTYGTRGIGIDINPERINEANENARKAGVGLTQKLSKTFIRLREETANLQDFLDSDRPTILRKLTEIENKIDRLLQQEQDDHLG